MINLMLLAIYSIGMVVGQVIFKTVAEKISNKSGLFEIIRSLLVEPGFYIGVGIYGLLTVYWIWLLGKISISYAYPFVATSIAIVVVLGWVMWGEKFSFIHLCGVLLVLAGVILIGVNGEQ